jgi:divalent metal cation (Fe/Co/Zn/Cd) transporter
VIHTGFHIELPRETTIEEADKIVHQIKEKVEHVTGCEHCIIQVDPANR